MVFLIKKGMNCTLAEELSKETVAVAVTAVGWVASELLPFVSSVKGNGILHVLYLLLQGVVHGVKKIHEGRGKGKEETRVSDEKY